MLDGTGHIGGEVGKDGFDMGKIKRARDVLGGVVKDQRQIGGIRRRRKSGAVVSSGYGIKSKNTDR